MRNRTSDLRIPRSAAVLLSHRDAMVSLGPLRSSYMTRVLHAARISKVDGGLFLNRIRKIVNFELG